MTKLISCRLPVVAASGPARWAQVVCRHQMEEEEEVEKGIEKSR